MRSHLLPIAAGCLSLILPVTTYPASSELRELYRGTRAQAMGGAFVALADDEQAIFMNPAGLAGIENPTIHYAIGDVEASTDVLSGFSKISTVQNATGDSLNALMGENVYGRLQFTPSFMFPNFGIAVLTDSQLALQSRNQALPNVTFGYQTTNGVQLAYGASLSSGFSGMRPRRRRGRRSKLKQPDFRVGLASKILWRRGGYRDLSLTQMLNLSQDSLKAMAGEYGRGIGFDAGVQYLHPINERLTAMVGVAITEIGDLEFKSTADPQPSNLSAGLALKYDMPLASIAITYDYRHILQEADWQKRTHFGTEIKLPMITLYAGLNQMYLTYGASFDAWLLKVTAVTYSEDLGATHGLDPDRRYLVRFGLNFPL